MKKGDLCFFYHSVKEKKIVGIVKVVKEHYLDPTDKTNKFVAVDISFKQSRLSVMPIDLKSWNLILKLSKK